MSLRFEVLATDGAARAGRCLTLAEGVDAATSALDSGRGRKTLARVRELS